MDHSPTAVAGAIVVIGSAVGVLAALFHWARPKWRRARAKWVAAQDAIIGRPAILDTITNEERVPALPGIGLRMAHMEEQQTTLTMAVAKIAETQELQQRLHARVDEIEGRVATLESAQVERIVGRAESTAAYRAIETAIKATPDVEAEAVDDEG